MPVCNTVLPVVSADYCAPNVNFARVNQIFFTRVGDSLTTFPGTLAAWTARLSNTTVLPAQGTLAPLRQLFVIGSLDSPSINELSISSSRKINSKPDNTITFEVDDTSALNYTFMKTIAAAGGGVYAVWFEAGGLLFGGVAGITATMSVTYEISNNDKELQKIKGTLKWTGDYPDRAAYPTV